MKRLAIVCVLAAAAPVSAQHIEVAPIFGSGNSSSLDRTTTGVQRLTIQDGAMFGGRGAWFHWPHVGFEGVWTWQSTPLNMTTAAGSAEVFRMTIDQLLGHVVYQAGGAVKPFVFGGAGMALFSSPGLRSEVKPAWDVGAGVKWFVHPHVGVEGRARYTTTVLGDGSSAMCGPFGFCQDSLHQTDVSAGAVFRF